MISVATAVADMPPTLAALTSGDLDLARVRLLVAAREINSTLFADHEQTPVVRQPLAALVTQTISP
jgi:hypothetical protein